MSYDGRTPQPSHEDVERLRSLLDAERARRKEAEALLRKAMDSETVFLRTNLMEEISGFLEGGEDGD